MRLGAFIKFLLVLAIWIFIAWLLEINPMHEYGWFMGLIHGTLFIPNWIISWFDPSWYMMAPVHTSAYTGFWWFATVCDVIGWGVSFIGSILSLFSGKE